MEEEEQEGLEILLKQRRMRPSYTRFISEDLSEGTSHQLLKAHKDGKRCMVQTDQSGPGEGDNSIQNTSLASACKIMTLESDSDSEYLSAAEEIDSGTDNDDVESMSASSPGEISAPMGNVNEKRTRCKKHRKRQRRQLRIERIENVPFMSEESIEVKGPHCSDEPMGNNPCVPTLAKLCIRSYCKKWNKGGPFPPGLNKAVQTELFHGKQKSSILKWLYRFLDIQESSVARDVRDALSDTIPFHRVKVLAPVKGSKCKGRQDLYHHRQSGSIWFGSCRKETNYYTGETEIYAEGKFTEDFGHLLDQTEHVDSSRSTITNSNGLSALARLIDLLLPNSFAHSPAAPMELKHRQTTALIRVKALLLKRHPDLIYYMFWEAVPYVWWSRGNPTQAEEAFIHLIQNTAIIKTDAQKAVYTNELARMYLHFGEYGKAIKTFALAMQVTDAACRPLVDLQTHVLVAAGLDTGILTQNYSSMAIAAWGRVLEMHGTGDLFFLSVNAAITSVMCHHAGIVFESSALSWKDCASGWLRNHATQFPQAHLGLCLIHAMDGEERDSEKAFRTYTERHSILIGDQLFGHLPGMGWTNHDVSQHRARMTPFSVIVKEVELRGCTIPTMRMIWRRKLSHFTLDYERRWMVGDDDHSCYKMWLCEDGLLACDAHLTLPPLPQVLLHPLTGEIQFGNASWLLPVCRLPVPILLNEHRTPRSHRLYEDDRVTVDLDEWVTILERGPYSTKIFPTKTYITRKQADGEVDELNLKRLIRDHVVQMTKNKIHEEAATLPETERAAFVNGLLRSLERTMNSGFLATFQNIETMTIESGQAKAEKKKKSSTVQNLFGPRLIANNTFPGLIVLLFTLDNRERSDEQPSLSDNPSVAVIIQFEDRESFLKPTLFSIEDGYSFQRCFEKKGTGQLILPRTFFMVSPGCGQENSMVMGTSYFGTFHYKPPSSRFSKSDKRFVVYNQSGEQVRVLSNMSSNIDCLKIAGDYLIHVDNESLIMKIEPFSNRKNTELSMPGQVERMFVLMGNVFVLTTTSLIVVDPTKPAILPWKMYQSSNLSLQEDGTQVVLHHRLVLKLLKADHFSISLTDLTGPVVRAIIGYGNHVLIIEVPDGSRGMDAVHCLLDIEVPGAPTEACFIGDKGGILVTATIFHELDRAVYQENLYHYTPTGRLVSLLPGLGHGPHGLYPLYHPGSAELAQLYPDVPYREPGWYIYLRDGYGAIVCARTECQ